MLSNLSRAFALPLHKFATPTLATTLPSISNFFPPQAPQLSLIGPSSTPSSTPPSSLSDFLTGVWLAVPKSKISPGKRRIKQRRYALSNKTHIQTDPITGEPVLRHRLPINWRHHTHEHGFGPIFHGKRNLEKLGIAEGDGEGSSERVVKQQ